MEDARNTKFLFRKIQLMEGGSFILAIMSIMLSIIEYQTRMIGGPQSFLTLYLVMITL
jgi:hypothetical protein